MSPETIPDESVIAGGDIILVVGQGKKRIQVSSEFLIQASPVFDAMLHLKFSECNRFHERNELPVEIKLPEDDGVATTQALRTLYGSDPDMLLLDLDEIQKVAIFADKYNMSPRFSMAATGWMSCEPVNLDQAWKLMTASYWFNLEGSFRAMSEHVVVKMNHAQIFRLAHQTHVVGLGLKLGTHGASKGRPMSTVLQNYGRRSRGHAARLPQSIQPPVWLIVSIYALAGARESGHVRYIGGEEE
ncbi:uncharacterized protein FMAN_12778 [Fusarium mangiferae]|uniref:BTB domain-containing protein n=1 Tax=Fusarium mangiferae TaxID=192010 RepID=A0A1L7UAB1_FUSMA|nr:uncharacterized protein FMAN_12778 [Fusarium mangiferae]CVL04667.1 uncharacterized protein FMAN_12778 [Fusarium mangiferae]